MTTLSFSLDCKDVNLLLRSHRDPIAFFTVLPRVPDLKISVKFYFILRKLLRTRKIFLKIIYTSL